MRSADGNGPLEEGWLLAELRDRFGMSAEELARRFDKSASWVSRRLSLVTELPQEIQAQVRRGEIVAHAAMKHLVPLARANREAAVRLAAALAPERPTSRQVAALYAAWLGGSEATRARVVEDPRLFLRARDALARRPDPAEQGPLAVLLADLGALTGVARRALRHLRCEGLARQLAPPEREEVRRGLAQAQADVEALFTRGEKEVGDAGPGHPLGDPAAA
jgi:ParB-like chromosome segregation protein Spo0J